LKEKNIYFASDIHLGYPNFEESLKREKLFVQWLNEIKTQASEIYLLGDIFDFWHEYKKVAPRGFSRFLGCISTICDSGVPVHFFTGNHDIWVYDYLPRETGMQIHRNPIKIKRGDKNFYIAHGDGLGPNDWSFKLMKAFFTNKIAQWLFARIHPNTAIGLGHRWSQNRRHTYNYKKFNDLEREWLIIHSRQILDHEHFDFFIYGHRHFPVAYNLTENSMYLNTGDWLNNFSYAVFNGSELELKKFSVDS